MYKCRNPFCNRNTEKEGWLCKTCYAKSKEEKEVNVFDILLTTAKRSKREHVIFIAYITEILGLSISYGMMIGDVNGISIWYGGFYTLALILGITVPGLLIWHQLNNEKKMILLKEKEIREGCDK